MTGQQVIRFGTRGSALARAQTDLVIARLATIHPEVRAELIVIQTEGDRDKTSSLTVIGGRGVFTTALQDALRRGEIDAAVHSAKDLPTENPSDLRIAAFLERADARDVFVSKHRRPLSDLDPRPVIGTSSRRRTMQVLKLRPDAQIVDLRGNIDTRLKKAFETDLDGIVLAAAGIDRMGWSDQITEYLPLEIVVPSPGQGALAVEIRADESGLAALLTELDDLEVSLPVKVERAFLRGMGGGCTSPVGAHASLESEYVRLRAMLGNADCSLVKWIHERLPIEHAVDFAESLSKTVLAYVESPMTEKRILVTTGGEDDRLPSLLRAHWAKPTVVPANRIEFVKPAAIETALSQSKNRPFDWVVFTSQNAVQGLLRAPSGQSLIAGASIAVVGRATRLSIERHGFSVGLQPSSFSAEALVSEMQTFDLIGKRILFPHGDLARSTVPQGLRAAGAAVETMVVYRTVQATTLDPVTSSELASGAIDAVIFGSPSSVRALMDLTGDLFSRLSGVTIACIGPTTAEAAIDAGLKIDVVPQEATFESLVDALKTYFANQVDRRSELVGFARSGEGGQVG
jgi:hydroxymethylbilane synthase